ncbi:uncharacterized protein TEOVI_000838000 [Trypanosoma equiperdum]|uniref:Uncharacterized protein n=1 Tax=Trypanosoma equiperdum TaxID=5694 RepID=A0A1G4I6N6_TRYEQ|nr:hypothetical protein, conserved [Trypanosoma equiperdum]
MAAAVKPEEANAVTTAENEVNPNPFSAVPGSPGSAAAAPTDAVTAANPSNDVCPKDDDEMYGDHTYICGIECPTFGSSEAGEGELSTRAALLAWMGVVSMVLVLVVVSVKCIGDARD